MAYARTYRKSSRYGASRRKRTYRKNTSTRRRSYGRKRTYRKNTSKRSLVNMMSAKKRDTMMSAAGAGVNPSPGAAVSDNAYLVISPIATNTSANNVHMTAFVPSWKPLFTSGAQQVAARTSTRTFVKGYAETYTIVPADASAWTWRRICVSMKGGLGLPVSTINSIGAQFGNNESRRYFKDITGDSTGIYTTLWDKVQDLLFLGVKTTDWADQMTAKVDTNFFNLHSDVTRSITSGNDAARPRIVKTYVPINKSVVYGDEENGNGMSTYSYSVTSKPGIGDIYVFDMFQCRAPISTTSSQIQIRSTATYYWHEK